MIIAQMVIEVLAAIASVTAAIIARRSASRAITARRETERLRSASAGFLDGLERPIVHVHSTLTEQAAAKLREDFKRAVRAGSGQKIVNTPQPKPSIDA